MVAARSSVPGRQQVGEMATPARRILGGAMATDLCGVEHGLDISAQLVSGLWLLGPDGLQHVDNVVGLNGVNPEPAQRLGIDLQGPLDPRLRRLAL